MNLDIQTKLQNKQTQQFICFACAVKLAIKDEDTPIEIISDEFGSDYDFRDTSCYVCGRIT